MTEGSVSVRRRAVALAKKHAGLALVLAAHAAFSVCYFPTTRPTEQRYMHHIEQAEAFLHLRVDIENRPHMEELILRDGRYYNIFPHGPSLIMMPLVLVFGHDFDFYMVILAASLLSIIFFYSCLSKIATSKPVVLVLTVTFAFGTVFLWVANQAGAWFTNQVFGLLFVLLFLSECLGRRRAIPMGIFLGFAVISRQPLFFYVILAAFALCAKRAGADEGRRLRDVVRDLARDRALWREMAWLLGVVGVFAGSYLVLNTLKFGGPFETGYDQIIDHSWFGAEYVVQNLYYFLIRAPVYSPELPFLLPPPDREGQAIVFTTPVVFLAFAAAAPRRCLVPMALTIGSIFVVHMLHQGSGGRQFGYRYALDYLPLVFCLLAYRNRERVDAKLVALSVLSVLLTVSGVLHLRVYY